MPQGQSGNIPRGYPLIALGSNEPDQFGGAQAIIRGAIKAMEGAGLSVVATSRLYQTPCFPKGNGPDFVNAAVCVKTDLTPAALLARLHQIEETYARKRAERWGPRTLDLDLIGWGDKMSPDVKTVERWLTLPLARQMLEAPLELILPHPRLQDRAFVLIPLAEIAPDWVHPILGKSVRQMVKALSEVEKAEIRLID